MVSLVYGQKGCQGCRVVGVVYCQVYCQVCCQVYCQGTARLLHNSH